MKKSKRLHDNIVEAPFPRRLGALAIDLFVTLVIALLAYMSVDAVFHQTTYGRELDTRIFSLKQASTLYIADTSNEITFVLEGNINDPANTSHYLARIEYFYTNAKDPLDNSALFSYEQSSFYEEAIPFDFYIMVLNKDKNDTVFNFVVEDDVTTFSFKPLISAEQRQIEWVNIYNQALKNFEGSSKYQEARKPLATLFFVGGGASIALGAIPTMLLMPLLLGHGQTIGKFMTGLAVVDKHGYRLRGGRLFVRYLILGFFELGASLQLYAMPLFVSSAAITVTNSSRAIHDLIAGTYVIDARLSKVFDSSDDENKYFNNGIEAADKTKIIFFQMPAKNAARTVK